MQKWLLYLVICIGNLSVITAQEDSKFIDLSKTTKFIDTLLIDRDLNNWSVRALSSYKQQRFTINTGNNKYRYTPNNPYGIGGGVGTKKVILDFTFNLKASEENPTERYDILWSFFKKNHLFDFYFQHYRGFVVDNNRTGETSFREDIRSLSTGVRYMYMFHEADYSIASMKTGLVNANKSTFSIGLGGFLLYNSQSANESIIPQPNTLSFTEDQLIEKFDGTAVGVTLGFSSLIVLPNNFFLSLNAAPGIGLMGKKVGTDTGEYQPENPVVHQLGLSALVGYNAKQYYINLSVSNGYYATDFNFGDEVIFGYINAKLAFGYKLKGKIKRNWKK
ncbi:DUF4421 family protein [Flavicella marina]|uniref:DUF4421 family protein n=1 Tax=Flavicella marina TaxID=1475951 RepID=UPI0012649A8E|nr:DUF4421 family protein [Flavicella marina]